MRRSLEEMRAELKSLPLLFGKALGGIAAVLGFGVAIFAGTRPANVAAGIAPWAGLVAGAVGICVYWICERLLARRPPTTSDRPTTIERRQTSALAWSLLLALGLAALLLIFALT